MQRRLTQPQPLEQRLTEEATRLRKEARGTPPGVERDRLIYLARRAEMACHMNGWLNSPGLRSPK